MRSLCEIYWIIYSKTFPLCKIFTLCFVLLKLFYRRKKNIKSLFWNFGEICCSWKISKHYFFEKVFYQIFLYQAGSNAKIPIPGSTVSIFSTDSFEKQKFSEFFSGRQTLKFCFQNKTFLNFNKEFNSKNSLKIPDLLPLNNLNPKAKSFSFSLRFYF